MGSDSAISGVRLDFFATIGQNAALPASGNLDSFSPEEIDRALDVNLRAGMQLARALLPAMVERGSGHLVFMSSMAGKVPVTPVYSATKYGLRGFAAALRDDLHKTGVGVSTIFPGPIEEAGMQADSGIRTPSPAGRRYPKHVAAAVVKAIEEDKPEITVASDVPCCAFSAT